MVALNHSIKVVSNRTGLSPHVIRIWEKRYSAVTPARSATNRRLYSNEEIERLTLLKRATLAGHSIRNVAGLSTEDLRSLVAEDPLPVLGAAPPAVGTAPRGRPGRLQVEEHIPVALEAIRDLDASALENVLNTALVDYGELALLQGILVPLIERIGESWRDGELKVAHEHIATVVLRSFLGNLSRAGAFPATAPELIVTTPPRQLHELGAILVAATAGSQGWRATYLGPCLPAEEIAGAAHQNRVRAVALSIVYPEDDPQLRTELLRLRRLLEPDIPIVAGGRAAGSYISALEEIGAVLPGNLSELRSTLDDLRLIRSHRP